MKNKFMSGFLSGLAGALFIFTIVLTIYVTQVEGRDSKSPEANVASEQNNGTAKATEVKETSSDEVMQKINKLETLIDKFYMEKVDDSKLADGIYKGLLASLGDPYSCYYTADEYKALMESTGGVYCGIGATVTQNVTTGIITIVKPFLNGPAHAAGILPGDIVYKVNGEEVTGKDLTEVVSKIKGEEGTKAEITIVREGETKPMEFSIPRKTVEVPTIEYEMLDNKIGYIAVSEFDEVTAEQFRKAVNDLEKQGEKGLVIDIRNNPGGLLDTVCDMLDRMLPKGLIVYTEDKYGKREEKFSDAKEEFNKPLAVLINGNSASASEIFAGAIQDYKRGTIVGTTSFGKGIVQSIIPLSDGTAIKVTVSKYFTPNGKNIHKIGIKPDVTVDLKEKLKKEVVIKKEEDNQLQKAIQVIKDQIKK
ncbi:S41 family peptidase [Anaerocolumna sp. AGMB13025]|uniref:S41 family peptidase n=1 Tax=Anaerocolumna sp. AGMB13025 TaxID=3039116 RepID=UPI00241D589A|nr:S41 family peptidase [Anaerocolumna sp. AGMB13025]WFR56855.1 S41 family peptidase [Anaerocolumna sp. AGMB13025]